MKSLNYFNVVLILTLISYTALGQNNALVLRNNPFIVINGGTNGNEAVLVINQPNQNGIVTSGSGGNIITQGEFDYVKWNTRTNTGTYTVPFTTDVGLNKIPLSVQLSTAGIGNGYLALSTWDVSTGAGQFDNTPYPSEVIHMAGANGQADVSDFAVDRFWIIDKNDPLGTGEVYTTDPTPVISFGYNVSAAEVGDGNNLAVGNLGAQRYDGVQDKWFGWFSGGTANGIYGTDNGAGIVSGATIPGNLWYRTWTLSDYNEPLPAEITYFGGNCEGNEILLHWETASELNNQKFEIYRSDDAVNFHKIGEVQGAGNSTSTLSYVWSDEALTSSYAYYKITQTDYNGKSQTYHPIMVHNCDNLNEDLNVYLGAEDYINIDILTQEDKEITIEVFDSQGKIVMPPVNQQLSIGDNKILLSRRDLSFGNYLVVILDASGVSKSKKLILN